MTDTVGITSSDATAALPANAALVNGTNSFSVTLKDAGNWTVTASDLTDNVTIRHQFGHHGQCGGVGQAAVADAG